jgi:hypothetical protein
MLKKLSPRQRAILAHALHSVGALVLTGAAAALSSPQFREFLGNDPQGASLIALVVPLLIMAEQGPEGLSLGELHRTLVEDIFYPAHEPRQASGEYRRVHHHLVVELDEECWICGVRHSDVLQMPAAEQRHWQLETHHSEIEWAAANGVDLALVMRDFPALQDREALRSWLDSEGNMLVLCATHHRGSRTGIHSISYPAWKLQRWQGQGFTFIDQPARPS